MSKTLTKKQTIRNLIIFIIIFNLFGWLAWMMAVGGGTSEARDLGNLIWLASPLLVSLLLRLFSRDWKDMGFKPMFKGNGKWYLLSILAFPIIVGLVLLIGMLVGRTSLTGFNVGLFIQALIAAAAFTFVKNIFEEFAWRGYLTPKIESLGINTIISHLVVGLIWGVWHIPYYLGLLDRATVASYTSLNLGVFIPLVILGMTLAGILFGEMRLLTGSTWPCVIMHTMSNVLILTLLVDGFVTLPGKSAILWTPSWEGVLSMVLITFAGIGLYRKRVNAN